MSRLTNKISRADIMPRYFPDPIDPHVIKKRVLDYFAMKDHDLSSSSRRTQSIVFPRQVLAYVLWHYTNLPQRELAPLIKRDRSTIPHSVTQIANLCLHYKDVRRQLIEIETLIDP